MGWKLWRYSWNGLDCQITQQTPPTPAIFQAEKKCTSITKFQNNMMAVPSQVDWFWLTTMGPLLEWGQIYSLSAWRHSQTLYPQMKMAQLHNLTLSNWKVSKFVQALDKVTSDCMTPQNFIVISAFWDHSKSYGKIAQKTSKLSEPKE